MVEAVGGAVLAGEAFLALERLDVRGVFDLASPVDERRWVASTVPASRMRTVSRVAETVRVRAT